MTQHLLFAAFLAASVLSVSGCAESHSSPVYTGGSNGMARLTPSVTQQAPSNVPQRDPATYVYRGGRDPVTGKAYLSY